MAPPRSPPGSGSGSLRGRTELRFAVRGGRTVLAAACSALPLQVQRPIAAADGRAILPLLTPSGSPFAGDEIDLEIECGPGTRVDVVQPGATKLNRCQGASIDCTVHARVAAGALLRYLPLELIPFADSEFVW